MTVLSVPNGHHRVVPNLVDRTNRIEATAQLMIMLAIGCAAGAASFTHVHNVAAAHGQGGWLAWADAVVLELMSVASGLELRRRRRLDMPVRFPAAVLVCAVALSIAAQVLDAEPSPVGWLAAALPALGFLVMVKIALGRMPVPESPQTTCPPSTSPGQPDTDRSASPEPAGALLLPGPGQRDAPNNGHKPDRDSGQFVPLSAQYRTADAAGPETSRTARTTDSASAGRTSRVPELGSAEVADVAALLPTAKAAHAALIRQGQRLTRTALTAHMRGAGNPVSNARASALVKILKAGDQTGDTVGKEFEA